MIFSIIKLLIFVYCIHFSVIFNLYGCFIITESMKVARKVPFSVSPATMSELACLLHSFTDLRDKEEGHGPFFEFEKFY